MRLGDHRYPRGGRKWAVLEGDAEERPPGGSFKMEEIKRGNLYARGTKQVKGEISRAGEGTAGPLSLNRHVVGEGSHAQVGVGGGGGAHLGQEG